MSRGAITDYTVFSWIADIVVDPRYRARGLGKWMMACIREHSLLKDTQMVLQTRDAHGLYEPFGFSKNPALMSTAVLGLQLWWASRILVGHDLNLTYLPPLMRAMPAIAEASIGRELTADALESGFVRAVPAYQAVLAGAWMGQPWVQTTVSGGVRPSWYPSTAWHTMSIDGWWRFLSAHGFRITPARWPVAVGATLYTLNNSILGLLQSAIYGSWLRSTRLEHDPVFILGHWRSGTTHLHELLALDERFAFPTTYECVTPQHFLLTDGLYPRLFSRLLPTRRAMDNMKQGFERPQEEEAALVALGVPSPMWTVGYADDALGQEYLTLRTISTRDRERWVQTFQRFLTRVTYRHPGRRLLLKSPPHTARLSLLHSLFPNARFVHIVRHPFQVFVSTVNLWRKLLAVSHLEGARKHFCKKCGTPLFNVNGRYPGVCMLYLGTLTNSVRHMPSLNLYCDSMLAWVLDIGSATRIQQGFWKHPKFEPMINNPVWPVSIKGVLMRERRVLLLRNPRMEWELPGGRLEFGETPEQGLAREISEECGLDVRVLSPLLIEPFEVVAGRHVLIIAYGCATADDQEPVMSDEHEGFCWISVEDLDAHKVPGVYVRAILAMVEWPLA